MSRQVFVGLAFAAAVAAGLLALCWLRTHRYRLDEETLLDQTQELVCPYCNASFDIELEGTEEDSAEETDKQDR